MLIGVPALRPLGILLGSGRGSKRGRVGIVAVLVKMDDCKGRREEGEENAIELVSGYCKQKKDMD